MKRNIKYFVIAVLTGMTLASCNWFDVRDEKYPDGGTDLFQ